MPVAQNAHLAAKKRRVYSAINTAKLTRLDAKMRDHRAPKFTR
jgi:hypothetical protein